MQKQGSNKDSSNKDIRANRLINESSPYLLQHAHNPVDFYQRVCQLAAGTGGWPLSVFLTPDQKPFYVGTYFPKDSRYGMPGFGTILVQLSEAYANRKQEIQSATAEFMHALTSSAQ